ncbi:EmrB/QacA family drug resistance transporter [Janthinobacterium sp. LM6]|uniref:MFS transporter n=1 Tax=Janthinobacterium sp. LM6 TaxID=1938606 RepID=UPI0009838FDE|nr:MFS transporter [Janthinobacterium sp. LM6]AQR68422.1 EmrB/QacA family drug resistance transporter [Janthinobacterium sp. LM6]
MSAVLLPGAVPTAPPPPTPPIFGLRLATGLAGVLLAVLVSGLNENITKVALADIRGAMGIARDDASWLVALYAAASVSAMAFAPWCSVTFSLRRLTAAAIIVCMAAGVLCPFAPNLSVLIVLRVVQGAAGGALPPMLMTVALRFLPPNIKLYGLGGYALSATFGPSLGTPLAAFWTEYLGWQWAFWQVVPGSIVALLMVSWGLPQDPLRLERFRQFDWRGLLLGLPAISMLVVGLLQGERLAWFASPLICVLLGGGAVLLVLFLINEWSHPLPFFKLQLLSRRNLSHALLTLGGVLFVLLAVILIPSSYLAQVHAYRPLQTAPVMLMVALPQLIALPLVAALCNLRAVDCRWVLAIGLALLALSCMLGARMSPDWIRTHFYLLQAVQIFAQPMAVIPLLLLATTGLAPQDGPFASAWFNTIKGMSAVVATGVLDALITRRNHFHSTVLSERLGNLPAAVDMAGLGPGLSARMHAQVVTLTSSDLYLIVAAIALAMILIIPILPTRVYPPRAA